MIGQHAPVDAVERWARRMVDVERRLADLERLPAAARQPGAWAAVRTTNLTGITGVTSPDGLAVTVPVRAGRTYKITGSVMFQTDGANTSAALFITLLDNTQLQRADTGAMPVANVPHAVERSALYEAEDDDDVGFKLRVARQSGTGNVVMIGQPTIPAFILVEDLGVLG